MPELHLKQPGFTCSPYESFTKHSQIIQNLEKQVVYNIYIEMNWMKLVLLMMQHILIVKI